MTREEAIIILDNMKVKIDVPKAAVMQNNKNAALDMAIKALEPCEDWYDLPSNEMILERARQASKDLRKRFREDLEKESCDEYGNYKYPGDIELSEPNTATSIPCGDAISFEAVKNTMFMVQRTAFISDNEFHRTMDLLMRLPSVNPQEPKWIPVSERLPDINDDVLISLEWGIDIGRYSDGEWCSEWINNYDDGNVLAWMPLPAPYEPQESEDEE